MSTASMMHGSLTRLDRILAPYSDMQISIIAACGVLVIAFLDHLTGYEISISLLYLGPVLLATWYVGRLAGAIISLLACASAFISDALAGQSLLHPAIETWNFLVRMGYFLVLVSFAQALRMRLLNERQLARTDALTGLFGRRAFGERLEHDIGLARRRRSPLTVAFLDLDNFKSLNDTHGHAEGDRVLRKMGRVLEENRREGDTVARLGGDEFALVFPDTDQGGAQRVIARVKQDLEKALGSGPWQFSCSTGAVTFQTAPVDCEQALKIADALMYDAKHRGKNTVVFKVVD